MSVNTRSSDKPENTISHTVITLETKKLRNQQSATNIYFVHLFTFCSVDVYFRFRMVQC